MESKSKDAKQRIMNACVRMFIEKGYKKTTMLDIINEANVSAGTFQNIFKTKDGVLRELVDVMFEKQFEMARSFITEDIEPVLLYALETSVQLTLAELNENLREIYVEAYTNSAISEYICQKTSSELFVIFGKYLPTYQESDFYEIDLGTSSIMRGYMARPCDKYFTLKRKLMRFLYMTLSAFKIKEDVQEITVNKILEIDIVKIANDVMKKLFEKLAMEFEFDYHEIKFIK